MKNKKLLVVAVLLAGISVGSAFATVGIGIGPQWNGAAGSPLTILFNEKMVVNIGYPYTNDGRYRGHGIGLGFDYLIGQYSFTDFGSGGFVDFGWHWGVGGAAHFYFDDGPVHYYYVDDGHGNYRRVKEGYEGFGCAIGALPIIGLDLGLNINPSFKINFFLQYQPVLGLTINRAGSFGDEYDAGPVGFWFGFASCAAGVRFHF